MEGGEEVQSNQHRPQRGRPTVDLQFAAVSASSWSALIPSSRAVGTCWVPLTACGQPTDLQDRQLTQDAASETAAPVLVRSHPSRLRRSHGGAR